MTTDIHSCSHLCDRPECVKARADIVQRLLSRAWEHRWHRKYREEAADTITALRAQVAELQDNGRRLLEVANGAAAECLELRKQVAELQKDAARLDWWFSFDKPKRNSFVSKYLIGMHERWTPARWRTEIDAAME